MSKNEKVDDLYTPDTETVRRAYVRYMRNAFIASTAEHEAEFDRWLDRILAETWNGAHQATLHNQGKEAR